MKTNPVKKEERDDGLFLILLLPLGLLFKKKTPPVEQSGISVTCNPLGHVSLNGTYIGPAPVTIDADPGVYEVTITYVGYETYTEMVTVTAGHYSTVDAWLVGPRDGSGVFSVWGGTTNSSSETFTPQDDYEIETLELLIAQYPHDSFLRRGWLTIAIEDTSNGVENRGVTLWQTQMRNEDLPKASARAWVPVDVPNIPVDAGVTYRVAVYPNPGWEYFDGIRWVADDSKAVVGVAFGTMNFYPRGCAWFYYDYTNDTGPWVIQSQGNHEICVLIYG